MSLKKALFFCLGFSLLAAPLSFATPPSEPSVPSVLESMDLGTPKLKSAGALAFGPENVLFVGDSAAAMVFAIDVADPKVAGSNDPINVEHIDAKIASSLGIQADELLIHDLAVHPGSHSVYLSVSRGRGMDAIPVLVRVLADGTLEDVALDNVRFSKVALTAAPAIDAKDRRGRSLRTNTITDIAYSDGKVYIAGLSNEEFASTLRTVPFPFQPAVSLTGVKIFHVAHGKYETHAPIRTFLPYKVKDQPHLIAAYTCTPLVSIPIEKLDNEANVFGKTVAELGAGNRPLDMISYQKAGKEYILIANSNYTLMRIDPEKFQTASGLETPLSELTGRTAGISYTALPVSAVLQLDDLNDDHVIVIQRSPEDGTLNLRSVSKRRM